MKRVFLTSAAATLLGASLFGCQNTARGVSEDAANTTQKVEQTASQAATSAAHNTKNAGDALSLTPKVKTAIVADSTLNDSRNLINVDTKDNIVHLKGHVVNSNMKVRASNITARTLKEVNSSAKISNELTVQSQ